MSITLNTPSIIYGETAEIIVNDLSNVIITPTNTVINISVLNLTTTITVKPAMSEIYYASGYNAFNQLINLNITLYVNITVANNDITINYNVPTVLNAYGAISYTWFPSKYLDTTSEPSVICTPLEDIIYTITGVDQFLTISRTYIKVLVNSNLLFTPSTPTIFDGNLLLLKVAYDNSVNDEIVYTWKSKMFIDLPPNCVNLKYGPEIKLHPYQNEEYIVNAYYKNNLLTSGNIAITVIPKPSSLIDIDILPYKWYKIIISRDRNALIRECTQDKILSHKIINFYYNILQTSYRMEWTNKNGISYKVNWNTLYQIVNESNGMILSFEQQWRFFQYIQYNKRKNASSNFGFLLNIINKVYLEFVQKIPLYPMEPAVG